MDQELFPDFPNFASRMPKSLVLTDDINVAKKILVKTLRTKYKRIQEDKKICVITHELINDYYFICDMCKNCFTVDGFLSWMKTNSICPLCRKPIDSIPQLYKNSVDPFYYGLLLLIACIVCILLYIL